MPYILPETTLDTIYLPPSQKNHIMAPSVFVLLHRDTSSTVSIVSVFLDLQDANAACLHSAQEAGVEVKPADSEKGSEKPSLNKEPLRWEAADGTSSWVERHTVTPRKNLGPSAAERPSGLKRNDSRLYINDEDDVIELADDDGHYD
ncbi:Hypothetical protein NCS54_00726800 [Fusarium falciforme]|uniref:Hypothetical protein n=1 Tax=Fusarium falciforme TaxID=195108 RepID=UPI002301904D|nr:Hypothetical protein NCS54_00726800 [Fusarium falciforme]KAJ4260943.1 hypothetical protein NW757_001332 [Fusarium falciforme]WAO89864.1 Hypothetical protein NCS54_00726800 [Fusarium falciforme]